MKKNYLHIIRFIIYILPIILIGWLIYRNFFPNIPFQVVCHELSCSRAVKSIEAIDGNYHINIQTPKKYESAQIFLTVPNNQQNDFINLSVVKSDASIRSRHRLALNSEKYDQKNWFKLSENNISLYQKNKKFDSVQNFLKNIPNLSTICQDTFNLTKYYQIPGYHYTGQEYSYSAKIMGSFVALTYLENGNPLNINLQPLPSNSKDQSSVIVTIFQISEMEEIISEKNYPVNSNQIYINEPDLATGVYRISINAPADLIFENISVNQKWFMFDKQISLAANTDQTDIYTNGSFLKNKNNKKIIESVFPEVTKYTNPAYTEENFISDAFIGFSPEQFFLPPYLALTNPVDCNRLNKKNSDQFDYMIIAEEESEITNSDNEITYAINLNRNDLFFDQNKIEFIVEASNNFVLHKIKIIFK